MPRERETAPSTGLLLLQDLAWRVVLGHPPHQFWESFMCASISVNLCFAFLDSKEDGPIKTIQQCAPEATAQPQLTSPSLT